MISADLAPLYDLLLSVFPEGSIQLHQVKGGDIHETYQVIVGTEQYFLKFNRSEDALPMFTCEQQGLDTLRPFVPTPRVKEVGQVSSGAYLLMAYYPPGKPDDQFWQIAGSQLARLHQQTGTEYGQTKPSYLGSIPLPAQTGPNWNDVFIEGMLRPMLEKAEERISMDAELAALWMEARDIIMDLLIDEPASLLHGDLWSGNLYCTAEGTPLWIDPSVRYGHRELDLAMTSLFGGFPTGFYTAYNEVYPLLPGWEKRESVYQLYFLFAHLALFGLAYLDQAKHTLRRIIGSR